MAESTTPTGLNAPPRPNPAESSDRSIRQLDCDRCGARMLEESCKIVCRNCGHRFDCSDLNLYFD